MRYVNEEGHPIEMAPEEPAPEAEHPPIEMDPVADFEKARSAMEDQIRQLNEELCKTREAHMAEKQERDLLIIQRDTARKERDKLNEKLNENMAKAEEKIYALRRQADKLIDGHEREMEAMWKKLHKPILWPCLCVFGFAVLSMLIGQTVENGLVASRLGEPLGYGCLAAATFFGGIIWERLGGGICGRKRVCNTKLGTGRDCRGGGDCG